MKCLRLRIFGIVQGVGYRFNTVNKAQELNLTGFVKNLTDGTVLVEACGKEAELNRLVNWCEKGPANAQVKKVEIEEIPEKSFSSFEVDRT